MGREGKGGRREGAVQVQVQVRAGADMEVDVDVDGCRAGWALKAGKARQWITGDKSGKDTTDRTGEAPKSTGTKREHQAREIVCVCAGEGNGKGRERAPE